MKCQFKRCVNFAFCLVVTSVAGCMQPYGAPFEVALAPRLRNAPHGTENSPLHSPATSPNSALHNQSENPVAPAVLQEEIPIVTVDSPCFPADHPEVTVAQIRQPAGLEKQQQQHPPSFPAPSFATKENATSRRPATVRLVSQNEVIDGANENLSDKELREFLVRYDEWSRLSADGQALPSFFATETRQPRQKTATQRLDELILEKEEMRSQLTESRRQIEKLEVELAHSYQSIFLANQAVDMAHEKLLQLKTVVGRQSEEISELNKRIQENELASLRRIQQLIDSVRNQTAEDISTPAQLPAPTIEPIELPPNAPAESPRLTPPGKPAIRSTTGNLSPSQDAETLPAPK